MWGTFFDLVYLKASVSNLIYLIVLILYLKAIGTIFELYNLQAASNEFQVTRNTILTSTTTALVYFLTPVYSPELPKNRLQILVFLLVIFVSLILWRIFYARFFVSKRFYQNALLICDEDQLEELVLGLENLDPHYKFIAYVSDSINKNLESSFHSKIKSIFSRDLSTFVREKSITEIVVAIQKPDSITVELFQELLESRIVIREYSQVYEAKTQRIPVQYLGQDFYRFFPFSRSNQNRLYLLIVRVLEVFFSVIGLLITILLIPIVFLVNNIANKGSLFYTQERVGKDGVVFKILKFRTMIEDVELENAAFATVQDKRITSFGKFMRKTRMYEFPQFVNILKGEMALIGPRPERPSFVKEFAKRMPFYETRHFIKPGLTGWASG